MLEFTRHVGVHASCRSSRALLEFTNRTLHHSHRRAPIQSMQNETCPICTAHQQIESLQEGEHWILRLAESAKNCPGYLYLEPREHIESFAQISPPAWSEFGSMMQSGMQNIQQSWNPRKIYVAVISEAVPHIHFHLVPRHTDESKGFDYLRSALEGRLPATE